MSGKLNDHDESPLAEVARRERRYPSERLFLGGLNSVALVGFALRLFYVFTNGLWNDEIISLRRATEGWSRFARWYQEPDPHPPLYYLFLRFVRAISFGMESETLLRIAGASLFFVAVGSAWWFGRKYARSRLPILVSIALIAVSPSHVYLGAELRMYGLLESLSFVLLLLVIDWLRSDRPSCCRVFALGLGATALAITQYTGLLIAASLYAAAFLVRLVRDRRVDFRLIAAGLITAAVFAPLLPVYVEQLAFIDATLYSTPLGEAVGFVGWASGLVGLAVLVAAGVSVLIIVVRRRPLAPSEHEEGPLVAVPLIAAGLLALCVVVISVVRDLDVFNFGVSPIAPLFVVFGLSAFAQRRTPRLLLIGVAIASLPMIPVTAVVNRNPARYEPNRVSTLDALGDAVRDLGGIDSIGETVTIVHIDWTMSNQYFEAHVSQRYPGAAVMTIPLPEEETLAPLLEQGFEDGSMLEVLVVGRVPHERIVARVPPGIDAVVVNPYVVLFSRE